MKPEKYDIDLGDNHYLQFTSFNPDRDLNPHYKDFPDIDRVGAIIYHNDCTSSIMFRSEVAIKVFKEKQLWDVVSMEPLTLSPSILCTLCKDHGFIRDSKWIKA